MAELVRQPSRVWWLGIVFAAAWDLARRHPRLAMRPVTFLLALVFGLRALINRPRFVVR